MAKPTWQTSAVSRIELIASRSYDARLGRRLTRVRAVGAISFLTEFILFPCTVWLCSSSICFAFLLQYVTMIVSVQYQIRGDSSNQIAASIENGIRGGKLRAGERLPTVRALAARLRVSPTTVAAAFNALRVRGLVHGSGRRGTVVNRRPPLLTRAVFPAPAVGLRNLADGGPDPAMLPKMKPYLARLDGVPGKYGDAENRVALVKLAARQFKS